MTDILERLNKNSYTHNEVFDLMKEARIEIERLRNDCSMFKHQSDLALAHLEEMRREKDVWRDTANATTNAYAHYIKDKL